MNGIQGTNTSGYKCKRLLDAVFTVMTYTKITVFIVRKFAVFYDGTISYLTVYTGDVLNNNNNELYCSIIIKLFQETFQIKIQELSVLKYLNFWIFQSPSGFIVDYTIHIIDLVNEWFPTRIFGKF